jgi:hypothetical protein
VAPAPEENYLEHLLLLGLPETAIAPREGYLNISCSSGYLEQRLLLGKGYMEQLLLLGKVT